MNEPDPTAPGATPAPDAQAEPSGRDEIETEDRLDFVAAWDAVRVLLDAVREFAVTLLGLARSELRLARVSWPLVMALLVMLVGLSLSLWISLIALIGWALYVATGSIGWALAALVGVHLLLLVATRLTLKRTARNMTLPATRAEVRGLLERARKRTENN